MKILDGSRLASERQPVLASRADAVLRRRGRPPTLLLLAFGDNGRAAHVERKRTAAAAAGVSLLPLILPPTNTTTEALAALSRTIQENSPDAVFLQFPFPTHISDEELARAIPADLDVDIMSPPEVARFFSNDGALPPVTVTAGLLLLDAYGVDIQGRHGIVIADPSPFALMFREAMARRGANMAPLVAPNAHDLMEITGEAELVVAAAAQPGLLRSSELAPGAVVIDVGYFNPGGKGDVEVDGVEHLEAIAPVPGGIGPMTISALLERTIDLAS